MSSGFYVRPGLGKKLKSARWSGEILPLRFSWGNEVSWKQEVKETLEKWGTKTRRSGRWSRDRTVKKKKKKVWFSPEVTRVLDPPTVRRPRLADGFILCISGPCSNWTTELCRARRRIASELKKRFTHLHSVKQRILWLFVLTFLRDKN